MSLRSLIQSREKRNLIGLYLSAVTEDVVLKMSIAERGPPADVSEGAYVFICVFSGLSHPSLPLFAGHPRKKPLLYAALV